jgi:hypothetical protein
LPTGRWYSACPSLADQKQVPSLLHADEIGITLPEERQLEPEQSTSAIVVHHPGPNISGSELPPLAATAPASSEDLALSSACVEFQLPRRCWSPKAEMPCLAWS